MPRLRDVIANCAAGFTVAWLDMHSRVPSVDLRPRVSGSTGHHPPTRDAAVVARYLSAQRAIRHCYFRVVAAGAPAFWPSARFEEESPSDPAVLVAALNAIARREHLLDDNATADLQSAERTLRPFWREPWRPPPPRVCAGCRERYAAPRRRECWRCVNGSRKDRQRA